MVPRHQRAVGKSQPWGGLGAKEQKLEPLLLGPPAFLLHSGIPTGTAQESQAKGFVPLLLSHQPKQEQYHHFTNYINLDFKSKLLPNHICPIASHGCPSFSHINLEAPLIYFQTSHQVHFSKCHYSKRKESDSSANNAAPPAEWKGKPAGRFHSHNTAFGSKLDENQ